MEQQSQEWFLARLGKLTASEFKRLRTPKSRASYARKIRDELEKLEAIAHGQDIELGSSFSSAPTDWGNEQEPKAFAMYEFIHDVDMQRVGFVEHPDLPFVGCSPDLLTPDGHGGVEAKCPYDEQIHLTTLTAGRMPDEHIYQVQGQIWICDLEWVDFISFDPRRELSRKYFEHRVYRDERFIAKLEADVMAFWEFVLSDKDIEPDIVNGEIPVLF